MTITYETLFEVLRREKNHEDLQKLDDDFVSEVQTYVNDKHKSLQEKPRLDQFMEGFENEQTALRIQLQNIKKIVKDLFDRRERKIMDMAINKAKTVSNIVDTSALLPEEKTFFEEQIKAISAFRTVVVEGTLSGQKQPKTALESPKSLQDGLEPKELNIEPSETNNISFKKVQIVESVPKFVGIDLEIYGPFNNQEEVELRPEIAEMLVKTNKAKMME